MNKQLLGALAALVVVVAIFFIVKNRKSSDQAPPAVEVEPVVNTFHPDSVVGFQWKTKSQSHSFTRKNRDEPWAPPVNPQDVQDRLNLIAAANYQPLEAKGEALVDITVAFGEKNQWSGAWDGKYFYWKDGNYKGQGFQPRREQVIKFEAGRFAFEGEKLDWCPQRIKTLEVKAGTLDYKLRQQGLKWIINEKEVDPTYVEQWFGRACSNMLEEVLDTEVAAARALTGELSVKFADGKSLRWNKEPDGTAFKDGNRVFVSSRLAGHFDELPKAPVIGDAPPPEADPTPGPKPTAPAQPAASPKGAAGKPADANKKKK